MLFSCRTACVVIVLEFKDKVQIDPADLDQVAAYSRDLKQYHEESHALEVVPILVPTRYRGGSKRADGVDVLAPGDVGPFLIEQDRTGETPTRNND